MVKTDEAAAVTVAVLDAAGVFQGVETVPLTAAQGRVKVPCDTDLKAGSYRWEAGPGRFMPVPVKFPDGDKALYDLMRAVIDSGVVVPPATTVEWLDFIAKRRGW
ncbi:hypothetical protein [Thalassospira sp.]|uniref:hypothetical protein n=1 Tax=Thalassospira sp. TaxID=1912094 RepID=UPI003AA9908B